MCPCARSCQEKNMSSTRACAFAYSSNGTSSRWPRNCVPVYLVIAVLNPIYLHHYLSKTMANIISNQNVPEFLKENLESKKMSLLNLVYEYFMTFAPTVVKLEISRNLHRTNCVHLDFYANVRSTSGKFCSRSSIVSHGHGINRI